MEKNEDATEGYRVLGRESGVGGRRKERDIVKKRWVCSCCFSQEKNIMFSPALL